MKAIFRALLNGQSLTEDQTASVFDAMMAVPEQACSDAEVGAFLYSTAARPLAVSELIGGARALRKHMVEVELGSLLAATPLLDTCGTGGSGLNSFNTSTVAAFVCAACGQHVTKNGNRASTSKSGSADLLEALGLRLDLSAERVAQCCAETKFCFMFAPQHHPATKRVARIRRELGFRTIFNFLGPLSNPAGASFQLLGVSDKTVAPLMAEALCELGASSAMVVRGEDGLDEFTLTAETCVWEVKDGLVRSYTVKPEDFGFQRCSFEQIQGAEPKQAAEIANRIISGEPSAHRDLVVLNSAAALAVAGKAADIVEGIALANDALDSGKVRKVLDSVVAFTNAEN